MSNDIVLIFLEYLTVTVIQLQYRQVVKKREQEGWQTFRYGKIAYPSNTILLISKVLGSGGMVEMNLGTSSTLII